MIGLGLAASGHFPYAVKYSGAMVVANLNFAILMRNEIFGRLLYWLVNTLFAKVNQFNTLKNLGVDFDCSSGPLYGGDWGAPPSCNTLAESIAAVLFLAYYGFFSKSSICLEV